MKLDKRLLVCAEMTEGSFVCDIGTDHGYLPAYLLRLGKCTKAIAADIGEKPLAAAKATFENEGIEGGQLILSDGLKNIPLDGVTDIVIAGMGGELISKIIDADERSRTCGANFILQPMTRASVLRRYLADNGFEVTEERAVRDGEFAYSVMKCLYTGVTYEISDVREQTGLTDASCEDGRKYIEKQLERMKKAADGMRNSRPAEAEKIDMTMEKIRKEKGISPQMQIITAPKTSLSPMTQKKAGITAVCGQVIPIRAVQKLSLPLISQTMLSKKQKRRERSL